MVDHNQLRVLIKFPIRGRKEKLIARLYELSRNIVLEKTVILISIDKDDSELYNQSFISRLISVVEDILPNRVFLDFCEPNGKIHAVNSGVDKFSLQWDIVITYSDDMSIKIYGFDRQIALDATTHFRDMDGALWYSDGFTHDRICTYPILTRKYYDRFGYIYNPIYKSLFCDNEQTEVGILLDRIKYQNYSIFQHDHPANVGGESDELLVHNESFWVQDEKTYLARRDMKFGITTNKTPRK